jgi:hypothetical protein
MTITTNIRSYPYTQSTLETTSSFEMIFPAPDVGGIAGMFGRTNGGAIDAIGFVLRILKSSATSRPADAPTVIARPNDQGIG